MTRERFSGLRMVRRYLFLSVLSLIMIYPILWLVASSFKPNDEIFASLRFLPQSPVWSSYGDGWKGSGQFGFGVFYRNTFTMVLPTVAFTVISSVSVAYGFTRFRFPAKKVLFYLMISTMMLPNAVTIIPRFILFRSFGWIDSYLPFIVPALFATQSFFIFLLVQFFRGIPREVDESALIDGCGTFTILTRILLPLSVPAIFTVMVFQFLWTWNDFFNPLIYINSVSKFTVSLGLRMALDTQSVTDWNEVIAMAVASMTPAVLLYFIAQRYFVEGIATTGIKG